MPYLIQWNDLPNALQQLFNDVTCGSNSKWASILKAAIDDQFLSLLIGMLLLQHKWRIGKIIFLPKAAGIL